MMHVDCCCWSWVGVCFILGRGRVETATHATPAAAVINVGFGGHTTRVLPSSPIDLAGRHECHRAKFDGVVFTFFPILVGSLFFRVGGRGRHDDGRTGIES
jgi:hypothetical protein